MEDSESPEETRMSSPWRTVAILLITAAVVFIALTSQMMY